MKILIVGQYYYPDNFRINDISKEFAQRGHRVTVLTGLPDYTTGKVPWKYKFFRRRREVVDGVDVIRVPIIARRTGFLFRAVNYLSSMRNLLKKIMISFFLISPHLLLWQTRRLL